MYSQVKFVLEEWQFRLSMCLCKQTVKENSAQLFQLFRHLNTFNFYTETDCCSYFSRV